MSKITKSLNVRVTYDVFGMTTEEQIEGILKNAGEYLRDNGLLTQEADVIMDDCEIGVLPDEKGE